MKCTPSKKNKLTDRWRIGLMHALLLLSCITFSQRTMAQKFLPYSWEDYISNLTQDEEQGEDADWTEWVDELTLLHAHPLDLNQATPEELEKIPTLTAEAVEQIQAYIHLNGPFQTLGELRLVPGLTEEMLRVAPLFLHINPATAVRTHAASYPKKIHGYADYRTDIPCYYRKGYCVQPGYAGDPLYHRLRGEAERGNLSVGVHLEKDAGERYFDSYGGFICLDGKGLLRRIVAGDYRAGFGQGLVLGSGSSWGITSLSSSIPQGIRPMKGMDEYRFHRGISTELHFRTPHSGTFTLTPVLSWRKMDATTDAEGNVQTLQRSGLHRTQQERNARRSVGILLLGGHLGWQHRNWALGTTASWIHSSLPFHPGTAVYRQIYPKGSQFSNLGVDYAFKAYRLQLSGEVAYNLERNGWATVHRFRWMPTPRLDFMLLPRFYSYRYHAFHASAPSSSGSTAQNESGVTLNVKTSPMDHFLLSVLSDIAHHPWPRYGTSQSAQRYRFQVDAEMGLSRQHQLQVRYQWRHGLDRGDVWRTHHLAHLQWEWVPTDLHHFHTTLIAHHSSGQTGWATSIRWAGHTHQDQWSTTLVGTFFHIPDYLQRIWVYEPSLLGSITGGTLYGKGLRGVGKIRWRHKNGQWMLEVKCATTYRMDTNTQSSGLQTILGHWKTDISVLTRFAF